MCIRVPQSWVEDPVDSLTLAEAGQQALGAALTGKHTQVGWTVHIHSTVLYRYR